MQYATMKQMHPRIRFMTTPAEMITIRCQTGLFLNDRGSSSASSVSAFSPSPTIFT